ncbi:hypothetical protein KI387_040058, partial [Taxus chinensis]
ESSMRMEQMVYAQMCVYMDMNQPLPAKILLEVGEEKWEQIDYENIPFRCCLCHEYGHLVKDCLLWIKEPIKETHSSENFVIPPKRKTIKEKNTGKVQQNNTNRFAALQSEEAEEDMEEVQETQVPETQNAQPPQQVQENLQLQSVSKALVVHQAYTGEMKSYQRKHKLIEEQRKEEGGNDQSHILLLLPSSADTPPLGITFKRIPPQEFNKKRRKNCEWILL